MYFLEKLKGSSENGNIYILKFFVLNFMKIPLDKSCGLKLLKWKG